MTLPEHFTAHDGGECPVEPDDYVELLIRTAEGLGSSGVVRARLHEWNAARHDDGVGAVVGYRLARRGEQPLMDLRSRLPER